MSSFAYGWCLLLWLGLLAPVWAQPEYEVSRLLLRLSDGCRLDQQEAEKLRTPASTTKLLTAALAWERLGPQHRFRTVVRGGPIDRRGRLEGPLTLEGQADPELTEERLATLVEQLWSRGLREVRGDLLVDGGPWSQPPYGPGWAWDDAGSAYSPEITGLALDGGLVSLSEGATPAWVVRRASSSPALWMVPGWEGVQVSGELPGNWAAPRSTWRTGQVWAALLQARGIRVRGQVREGAGQGAELASLESAPLRELLSTALAESDNLTMELLYRACQPGSLSAFDGAAWRWVDGSGLSRYNLLSAEQLVAVLRAYPELRDLLPQGGEGTLRNRFLEPEVRSRLRAKTGTLSQVSGLAGYLDLGSGQQAAFAILIQGHLGSAAERKALEEAIVSDWLARFAQEVAVPPR